MILTRISSLLVGRTWDERRPVVLKISPSDFRVVLLKASSFMNCYMPLALLTNRLDPIEINWRNIQSGTESIFQAHSSSQVSTLNRAYDLGKSSFRAVRRMTIIAFIQVPSCITDGMPFPRMVNQLFYLVKPVSIETSWAILSK